MSTKIPNASIGPTFSFWSAVKTAICFSVMFDHCMNCCFHCMTDTLGRGRVRGQVTDEILGTYEDVHKTRHDFLIVQAAVIPTNVFPAPHGNTIIPERARLFATSSVKENIVKSHTLTRYQTFYLSLFLGTVE